MPPLFSFFKPAEPVSDADHALADIPEFDWAKLIMIAWTHGWTWTVPTDQSHGQIQ
jgi:hypothetical protein